MKPEDIYEDCMEDEVEDNAFQDMEDECEWDEDCSCCEDDDEEDDGERYEGPATDTRYVSGCCSMCGSEDNVNTLESFLKADGFDVEQACDILDIDPFEEVCKECYDSWKDELNQKMYSEYNDLGTDIRTGEPWGGVEENSKKKSAKALYEKVSKRVNNLKKNIRLHEGEFYIMEPEEESQ